MDASVCCLPAGAAAAATGVVQHHHPHPASLPGLPSAIGVQPPTIQPPYVAQYAADQIVPDRAQPDGPLAAALAGCNAQDGWQQISSTAPVTAAVATTTAYIDYSWLQMQVSKSRKSRNSRLHFNTRSLFSRANTRTRKGVFHLMDICRADKTRCAKARRIATNEVAHVNAITFSF